MSPVESLFALEVEYHRRLRVDALGSADLGALHTSYALQHGYDQLIREAGGVTAAEIGSLATRMAFAGDTRDVLTARDSLMMLFGIGLIGG